MALIKETDKNSLHKNYLCAKAVSVPSPEPQGAAPPLLCVQLSLLTPGAGPVGAASPPPPPHLHRVHNHCSLPGSSHSPTAEAVAEDPLTLISSNADKSSICPFGSYFTLSKLHIPNFNWVPAKAFSLKDSIAFYLLGPCQPHTDPLLTA